MPNIDSILWIVLIASITANLALAMVLWRRWRLGRAPAAGGRTADQTLALTIDGLNSVEYGVALFDRDDRLVLCNTSYRRAHALSADLMVPGAPRAEVLRTDAEVARRTRTTAGEHAGHEPGIDRLLDDDRWYRISESPTSGGGTTRILTDVTDVKRQEAALQNAQKVEAIGQMAAGLAHELNNIFTAIGGFSELARQRLEQPKINRQRIAKLLNEIAPGVRQGSALTRQIITFSRRQPHETKIVAAGKPIDAVKHIIGSLVSARTEIDFDLGRAKVLVEVDPSQLELAIVHLALNARDAMPDGGTLSVGCKSVSLDPDFVSAHEGGRPGPHAAISVADTGIGMDADIVSRVFEPYFTAREDGTGTGLGLTTVQDFVRQAGGIVTVESQAGKGSVFTLFLPIVSANRREQEAPLAPRGGSVLVVDDEQTVRDFATLALEDLGYQVHCAKSADEALATLGRGKLRADVLLTDVMMPGLSGPDLARQVEQRHPEVAVIYMSGYEHRRLSKERMVAKGEICLFKPFTQEMLDHAVRRALGRKAGAGPASEDNADAPPQRRKQGGIGG